MRITELGQYGNREILKRVRELGKKENVKSGKEGTRGIDDNISRDREAIDNSEPHNQEPKVRKPYGEVRNDKNHREPNDMGTGTFNT